jgi:IS1 family transposase
LVSNLLLRDIKTSHIQVDEVWTFVGKKQRYLTNQEVAMGELGTQFIFVAMDRRTKLVPCFKVGKRGLRSATELMFDLKQRIAGRPHITTDRYKPYISAALRAFRYDRIDFTQLMKVYSPNGNPRREGYSPVDFVRTYKRIPDYRLISTSHVERQNLTLRMSIRRLTRLTNGFSKKLDNLKAAVSLHFAYYNFARIHGSLRITPAMASGITDHIWSIEEILRFSNS